MFEAFYQSAWQQPGLLVVAPLVLCFFLPRRRTFLASYLWLFTVETVLDAGATSPFSPFQGLGLVFVLLGDARVFVLTEHYSRAPTARGWLLRVLGLTAVVPVAQALLLLLFPDWFDDVRHTYLVYECLFVSWIIVYRTWILQPRVMSAAIRGWLNQITHFSCCYYVLWALADVLILSGSDLGFGLRVVPNLLYYGFFLPFVLWSAPQEAR